MTGQHVSALPRPAIPEVVRAAARQAWDGLVRVLTGPDPAPAWRGRSAQERWAVFVAVGLLCALNAATVHGVPGAHGTLPSGTGHHSVSALPPGFEQRALGVAVVAPLLLAVRFPTSAWRIGWVALLLAPLAPAAWWGGWPWGPPQIIAVLAQFCLAGISGRRPVLWWMWAFTLVPWSLWLAARVHDQGGPVSATIIFALVAIALDSVRARQRTQLALTVQTERTQAEQARRAALEERTRISRELHDVVAHHMSLVAVRAETAPYRLVNLSEPVRAEFAALSDVAREALADMRRLLGVLRYDQPAELAPQPRLADLPALVDAARRAGVSVELSVPGTLARVPAGVALCAYRIVQESLSNVSQHAPGAAVTVSVDVNGATVVLQVANEPADTDTRPADAAAHGSAPGRAHTQGTDHAQGSEHGAGHGLAGMRERVALLGGSLSAGPAPGGGFVVSAVLPLGEAA
ncbi:MAG: sensor histidine kinase [Streptosporangiaceae bacterium]